jgi:hypothetical protein
MASPASAAAAKGHGNGSTVTVACKVPIGIELQLQRKSQVPEPVMNTGAVRMVDRWEKYGRTIAVFGPAYPVGQTPRGMWDKPAIHGGYALTPNVPADFWDEWLEQNRENPVVTAGLIFAHARRENTIAEAREKKDLRSGLEPLNPDNDPRMPRALNTGGMRVTSVETADEAKGRAAPAEAE